MPVVSLKKKVDTLLNNAVQSIQVGVEDFQSSDPRRVLSAVRNITAGVLLLFKEQLKILSPSNSNEVLLKQRIRPSRGSDGKVSFVGNGKKTVDVSQIRERFEALGITVDWKRLDNIVRVRNDIEHYCTNESDVRVKELLSNSFVVIRDFVFEYLNYEPVELLGEEAWSALLTVSEVYERELAECQKELESVRWSSETLEAVSEEVRCPKCHSKLVKPTDAEQAPQLLEFHCSSCGEYFLFEDVVTHLVQEHYFAENYIAGTDGGDPPTTNCHECGEDTFVLLEGQCVKCGATLAYETCTFCGEELGPDEQGLNGLCSYHYHMASKND